MLCVVLAVIIGSALAVLPQQIRLALTAGASSDSALTVVFATSNLTEGNYVPIVTWGITKPSSTAGCNSYNYTHEPAWQKSTITHVCNVTDLTPNTFYVYQVGSVEYGLSELLNFTSPPPSGSEGVNVVMYGDMGASYSKPTASLVTGFVKDRDADLVIHCGDISYADDRADIRNGTIYEGILDDFYNEIQPYAAYVPYMMSPGNHESIYNFIAYEQRVATSMPSEASGSNSPFWYSYDYGLNFIIFFDSNIHFIAFSLEQPYSPTDPQGIWLMNDILQASSPQNRTLRPWVVAYAHRPMWCSNTYWCPDTAPFKQYWEDTFNSYVDMYIAGHVHVYERIWPVAPNGTVLANDYLNMQTTFHICTGSPGCMEIGAPPWYHPRPAWSAMRYEEVMLPEFFGVSHVNFVNGTHAHWNFVNAHTQEVVDDLWVTRQRS